MYRWIDHTAELELEIAAPTEEGVFAEALTAFAELVDGHEEREDALHEIAVSAFDRPALLAAWLEELVFLAETEGFVPGRVTGLELAGCELRASVAGCAGDPRHLVKSVTYHCLELRRDGDGWLGRAVLDV